MPTRPTVLIQPAKSVIGTLGLPGDKSISHRYAMLAAIADGSSRLENYSTGQDCASTLNCIRAVGCQWKHAADAPDTVIIQGCGPTLHASRKPLEQGVGGNGEDCGPGQGVEKGIKNLKDVVKHQQKEKYENNSSILTALHRFRLNARQSRDRDASRQTTASSLPKPTAWASGPSAMTAAPARSTVKASIPMGWV